MSRLLPIALLLSLSGILPASAGGKPGLFDFYVLALSWSPTWCLTDGAGQPSAQCDGVEDHGFVVHGLWPQYEQGYPRACASRFPPPNRTETQAVLDLMPDTGLVRHEWNSHGTCSGMMPRDYFATLRKARARVTIPDALDDPATAATMSPTEIESAFIKANRGLAPQAMAVICDEGMMSEVRICMDRSSLDFRQCPEVDRKSCRQTSILVPPVE